jgi:beta-lactamase regulating signal transducer with metallopeptidase domain
MDATLSEWFTRGSDMAFFFGTNLLVHSTFIIILGLVGSALLALLKRGATARSLFLRGCLTAVMLNPLALILVVALHQEGRYLPLPFLPAKRSLPPAAVVSPVPAQPRISMQPTAAPVKAPSIKTRQALPVGMSPAAPGSIHKATSLPASRPETVRNAAVPRSTETPSGHTASSRSGSHDYSWTIRAAFLLVWALLAFFLLARAAAIMLYMRRIRLRAAPARKVHIETCLAAAREMGISPPPVYQSSHVAGTILTGFLHPVILLPLGENELLMTTREVFLHELAHLARRDHLWLLFCEIAKVLLPFQPLLWLLGRRIEEIHDFACDDYVLKHTGGGRPYAVQLYNLALTYQAGYTERLAGSGIISSKSPLRKRIEHILDTSYARHVKASANEIMSFAILFFCAVTLTGFVGIRGVDLPRAAYAAERRVMQKIPETISRNATALALAAPVTVQTQVSETLKPLQKEHTTEQETGPLPETVSGSEETAAASQGSIPAPADTAGVTQLEFAAASMTLIQAVQTEGAPAADYSSDAEPVPSEVSKGTAPVTGAQPQKKESALAQTLPPSLIELHSSATNHREIVVAKPGPVAVTIPGALPEALKASLEQGQENPVWSPSGKLIAFTGSRGVGLWVVPVQGGNPVLVHDNTGDLASGGSASPRGIARTLCFTPNGHGVTFMKYVPESSLSGANKQAAGLNTRIVPVIETVNLLTGLREVIVEDASDGCWSPDGKYFVYVDGDLWGVNVLDLSTGNIKQVSADGRAPTITPDSSTIIYVDWGANYIDELYKVPITGGKPVRLTFNGFWSRPVCSPDGEWVLSTGKTLSVGSYSMIKAYNLKLNQAFDVFKSATNTAEMGAWSPSGRQYCFAIFGSNYKNGENTLKSNIEIGDFTLPSLVPQITETSGQPLEFKLIGNFPNPFNPSTTIRFSLPSDGFTELVIYSMNGQKIRELLSGSLQRGMHSALWDGRDQQGNPVSSGVYISRLKMEGKVETRRMTLVK